MLVPPLSLSLALAVRPVVVLVCLSPRVVLGPGFAPALDRWPHKSYVTGATIVTRAVRENQHPECLGNRRRVNRKSSSGV